MMKRYAIYAAPGPGPLATAAAQWLGWDPEASRPVGQPALPGLPRPLAELTAAPRKYGLHGTLKAPFRLAEGCLADDLAEAVGALAHQLAPVAVPLEIAPLGDFLALRPAAPVPALAALAAEVVTRLDPYRAPLSAAELARRHPETLSPRQRALLDRFGYPYVQDEFRFHMTLTGPLAPAEIAPVTAAAAGFLGPHLPQPFGLDHLCLFGEDAAGRFHLLHRYALTG